MEREGLSSFLQILVLDPVVIYLNPVHMFISFDIYVGIIMFRFWLFIGG
jgi:hypothetical protein